MDTSSTGPDLLLSDPDLTAGDLQAVELVLRSPRMSAGPRVREFERAFAARIGRSHAVATSSGTLALLLLLRSLGLTADDEVVTSPYAWHQIAHAIALAGARTVIADIDYWSGTLSPEKAAAKIGPRARVLLAGNTNGHPAAWEPLRALAAQHGVLLVEDSTEAIGSRYRGRTVGTFGDVAVFDFSQPGAITCGEGAMLVTDDGALATELRCVRSHGVADRTSVSVGSRVPLQADMSDIAAALGLAQIGRLDAILERRKRVEDLYLDQVRTFEGIKPPYRAPEADEVHWMLYVTHLGTRFSRSLRNQIVDDLATSGIEAAAFCQPLHLQFHYAQMGYRKGDFFVTEKIADRCIALPFHAHLDEDEVRFIVQTAKDSSINVGAGTAIY